jgi:glycosyltransferase involved in cell wall biosynthesis
MLHLRVVAGTGGGPEKTILNSPRFIREHGYNARVVYLAPPQDSIRESLLKRASIADCPLTILDDRGPTDWRVIREIIRICKQDRIDLIQSHDYKTNAIALLVRRFHRCKLATMLHGWTDMSGRMPIYKRIDQWCLPWFDKLICVSEDLVGECRRLKIQERKIHLVHNAIDTKEFARRTTPEAAKLSMQARTNRWLIGSVGRLSPEKGFLDLINVVKQLQDKGRSIDLWIAGDGPQRSELQALIEQLGLGDSVCLLGQLADTKAFYQAMDLFVLNSIREGLPNVILEAMAFQVPVIATRIAGIPTLIRDQETGRLIEPGNSESLKNAVSASLDNLEKGREMARAARRLIECEYSFVSRMEKVARIYDSLF